MAAIGEEPRASSEGLPTDSKDRGSVGKGNGTSDAARGQGRDWIALATGILALLVSIVTFIVQWQASSVEQISLSCDMAGIDAYVYLRCCDDSRVIAVPWDCTISNVGQRALSIVHVRRLTAKNSSQNPSIETSNPRLFDTSNDVIRLPLDIDAGHSKSIRIHQLIQPSGDLKPWMLDQWKNSAIEKVALRDFKNKLDERCAWLTNQSGTPGPKETPGSPEMSRLAWSDFAVIQVESGQGTRRHWYLEGAIANEPDVVCQGGANMSVTARDL